MSTSVDASPPRAPPVKYATPLGTRWQKEKAAAGTDAFEYPDDAKYVGPWIIGECVGKGASGRVKIARHRRTGQLAAVKILPLQPFLSSRNSSNAQAKAEKQRLGIDREIIMMKLMNHPNIMRIYDVYEGEKELYLILEYVEGGELFDFLVNRGRLPPLEALAYFKQVVYGLNYAHTFSIIHRDLKPENILIHSLNPPLVKIADWGMAAFAPPTLQLETSCGSPHYASPEIVNGHKYCGTATDIWSCGVILYALLTGRLPFDDKNVRTLLTKVKVGKYDMPSFVDPLAKDLLSRMLVVDVNKRISMAEILAHPWLDGATPGITYVPAPPVSELARPLPSALHIDRDLFESLCVIWGRHADIGSIRLDLLSPAGLGTLAKAFYFLLHKHREQTMGEHGILMDIDEVLSTPGKVITKQYAAPRSKPGRHSLDLARGAPAIPVSSLLRSDRPAPAPPSRTPSPKPRLAITTAVQAPARPHPPSPVGPRPQKPPRSSYYTASHPGVIHAPVPLPAAPQPVLPMLTLSQGAGRDAAQGSPMLTTPRYHTHPYASSGNAQWNAADGDRMLPQRIPRPEHRHSIDEGRRNWSAPGHASHHGGGQKSSGSEDKENRLASGTRTSQADSVCNSGGLGFGHSVPMAKEMGNVLFIHENGYGHQQYPGKKSGKGRPPPLDFHGPPVLHKRSTFSVGSPRPGSPPTAGMSPAVGEFKGWFSNLFHWKVQSIVLYSVLELPTTRSETTRLLEHFGVSLAIEDRSGFSVLLCRMDDIYDGSTMVQKQVRFRVEFSSCSSVTHSHGMHTTPRMGQMSFPGARSRADGLAAGYETVIGIALEKGSVTTFKNLCQRLRNEWRLDALVSPTVAAAANPGIQQQFMV
ncbi:Pkinase-domain-containing protein [Polyporus arcularius HHB13444]|uniref:Pkinase-domain-containing protein n=1 Tax=Polyporus arcularius HHB13444 TaxID=1314778 RepID=A0A5C3PC93_9APHY|nr:Pkinase-domain-containing protein [Polyporus arcularius HHB13444]